MRKYFSPSLKKNIVEINIGDCYVTWRKDEVLYTVLGSCVSVCFWDYRAGVIGMNHFMLPEFTKIHKSETGKFGNISLPLLLKEMIKCGANIRDIRAGIFGGAFARGVVINVGEFNIKVAREFLHKNKIPIMTEKVGGNRARRLYLYAHNQKTKVVELDPLNKR